VALLTPAPIVAQSAAQSAASAPATPSLRVASSKGTIRLDGRLDEPEWARADSIAALTEIEPTVGATPAGRTVIRVIATENDIIFGIRADDPRPTGIVSFARERDASLTNEDHLKIVLDTYLDGRSGYVFAVNPNGARYDALVTDQGATENASWDAVWDAATARWAGALRDYKVTQTYRAGRLTALPDFALGIGLSVRPAITAGAGIPQAHAELRRDQAAILDVTQRLGANALGSLTVNTDFAETEVDTRRTNLTRFPLVFPEKRSFFLEGADIFDFGLGIASDVRPFFSRRIGLLNGQEIPIRAGAKINGRQGRTNVGALVVHTGRADAPGFQALATDNTMGVLRLRQNVLRESSVGLIGTFGDPTGAPRQWLAGTDATFQTSRFLGHRNLLAGVWQLATSHRPDALGKPVVGRANAFGAKVDFPNDLVDVAATYKWLGDAFAPAVGFVPRPAVQIATLNVNYSPRPQRPVAGLHVRQMVFESQNTLVADLAGHWESYRFFTAPVNWRLESGDRFELNVVPTGERLLTPFKIADGVTIPTGTYHWKRYRAEAGLAAKRRFSGQATWWFGDFYSGSLNEFVLTASWKPSSLIIVEVNGTRNEGALREGRFTQNLFGSRLRVNVSPNLQFNSYMQYDNSSDAIGANTRLRWTFSPLGDLFIVYNHNLQHDRFDAVSGEPVLRGIATDPTQRIDSRWGLASNQLLVKVQYAFRY
jgi:hypothetical protein